jgi:membrane fusion protein (multidrug efflux system)
MRRTAPILFVILLAAFGLSACKRGGAPGGPGGPGGGMGEMPPMPVETAHAAVMALPSQIETVGSLRASESVVLKPEVAGRIQQIHFREGQHVAAGDLLFSLDPALAQADLNEAAANLENSKRAYSRASELAGKQLIARSDYDNTRATFEVNQARAASARTRIDKTRIRAPFAGMTGLRDVSVGDYVNVGDNLVDLVRLDPMQVDFRIPEVQLGSVAVGQTVKLDVDAFPGQDFDGKIIAIDPMIDVGGRSAQLRAQVANVDGKLRPGLFARVRVVLGTNPHALMIPEQAIWPVGEQKEVFLVENGIAKLVPVKLGTRLPGQVEIVDGLKAGDEVVTAGQAKLQVGMKVMPLPSMEVPAVQADKAKSTPAAKPATDSAN